jgi:hypothetical protein
MSNLSQEHQAILDKQVADWTKEMRHWRHKSRPQKAVTALSS